MKLDNLKIVENSMNFNPRDLDEIMLSNDWMSKDLFDKRINLAWSNYDVSRSYDYVAVAKIDSKTIGILEAFSDRDNFANSFLYSVMVHKDYQRKGVGRALMRAFNKRFTHTTTWAIAPLKNGEISGDKFLQEFGFKNNENFDICTRFRNSEQGKNLKNKDCKFQNLKILENCADFYPKDIDEIQLSIGWTEQKYLDLKPDWVIYDVLRNVDYYAIAKIGDKTVGLLEAFTDRDNFHTSYLYSIMVHKDYQNSGIGSALMKSFDKKFANTTTFAITPKHKADYAVKFLENFGFKENSQNFTVFSRKRNSYKIS